MAIISQETWDKFTEEEKSEFRKIYNEISTDYQNAKKQGYVEKSDEIFDRLIQLEIFYGKENLQTETNPLSKEEQKKIIDYCKNKFNEVKRYLSSAKSLHDVESIVNLFAEASINDAEEINSEIANFTLIFDQIMLYGYVTPCGVVFDTNVSYCSNDDNGTIYEVDINTITII